MNAVLTQLTLLEQELRATPAWPWQSISAWIAKARVIVRVSHPDQVALFDELSCEPSWVQPLYACSEDVWGNRVDNFAEASSAAEAANQEIASGQKSRLLAAVAGLIAATGCMERSRTASPEASRGNQVGATIIHGSQTNIFQSPGTAVTFGPNSPIATPEAQEQQEHVAIIREIQIDLVRLQDSLDQLGTGVTDALWHTLRQLAHLRVQGESSTQLAEQAKDILDDMWARHAAQSLRPQLLSGTPEMLAALAKSPLLKAVVEKLLTSAPPC